MFSWVSLRHKVINGGFAVITSVLSVSLAYKVHLSECFSCVCYVFSSTVSCRSPPLFDHQRVCWKSVPVKRELFLSTVTTCHGESWTSKGWRLFGSFTGKAESTNCRGIQKIVLPMSNFNLEIIYYFLNNLPKTIWKDILTLFWNNSKTFLKCSTV